MGELVLCEHARDFGVDCAASAIRVSPGSGLETDTQADRRGLHDLYALNPRNVVNLKGQRRDGNAVATLCREGEYVGGAALHADCGERVAAGAGVGPLYNAVP